MYKKNKFSKLFCFCAVVENDSSITKASKATNRTIPDISDQVRSLEIDLGYKLFDRIANKVVLNNRGRGFYEQVAKPAVTSVLGAYSDPEFTNIEIEKQKQNKYIYVLKKSINTIAYKMDTVVYDKKIKVTLKKEVRIKLRHVWYFVGYCIAVFFYFYLMNANYFFDRKMKKISTPFLREIMTKDYYRIDKNIVSPGEPMQLHLDVNEMVIKLLQDGYKIGFVALTVNKCPAIPMRMNDTDRDNVFSNKDRFEESRKRYRQKMQILKLSENARIYNIYHDIDCQNYDIFLENTKKHNGQLFGINTPSASVDNGGYFIIKYKKYYYLIMETNGLQYNGNPNDQKQPSERYLIWKKLTLEELMHYDNGSYWKLIKDYNIKID